jgi:hypothetical protein
MGQRQLMAGSSDMKSKTQSTQRLLAMNEGSDASTLCVDM